MATLHIHAIIDKSVANGPGERVVVWTQGCQKGCLGCFNPETWSKSGGRAWEARELAEYVVSTGSAGLTLTGGDPMEQAEGLLSFLEHLHDAAGELAHFERGILLFTGFTLAEIESRAELAACLPYLDVIIDGRYEREEQTNARLAGSANQNYWFSNLNMRGANRIPLADLNTSQVVEIHANQNRNCVVVTGFPVIHRATLIKLGIKIL